jgi:hypothetical protein
MELMQYLTNNLKTDEEVRITMTDKGLLIEIRVQGWRLDYLNVNELPSDYVVGRMEDMLTMLRDFEEEGKKNRNWEVDL